MTTVQTSRRRRTWWQLVGYLVKRATLAEIHGYQGIYRFVLRRPRVPARAVGFSYHQPAFAPLIVFIVVSAVELVVVDLIVHRWPSVRIPLLILGVWGLVWMIGLLLGMITRPHAVGPEGIRARYAAEVDLPLSWDDVYSVGKRKRVRPDGEPKITTDTDGTRTLHLRMGNETNIDIRLERPIRCRLPSGAEEVERVALYADDPAAFLAEVRRHIG